MQAEYQAAAIYLYLPEWRLFMHPNLINLPPDEIAALFWLN